jgi:lysophospholipase L1-like esterase
MLPVLILGRAAAQSVTIVSPPAKALFQQVNGVSNMPVTTTASGLPSKGGVEIILDKGTANQQIAKVFTSPYNYTFSAVPVAEHTLDVFAINASSAQVSSTVHEDRIGVGDLLVAVGDSITAGEDNFIAPGDTTSGWSLDGRNGPFTDSFGTVYGPWESKLNDYLTADQGYPHSVINGGWPGDKSANGVSKIGNLLNEYPTASIWMIAYGTNDANGGVSSTAFQSNMQSITNKIHAVNPNAAVYLSRVFYQLNTIMPQYEIGMGNIVRSTANTYWGADLNTLFQSNYDQYDMMTQQPGTWFYNETPFHPNALGSVEIAKLWEMAIMDRAILVTDGYLPVLGSTASHRVSASGCNNLGLSSNNLMMICERPYASPPIPPGVSFAAPWSWSLNLTGSGNFSGGSPQVTVRQSTSTLTSSGASSWNQAYLSNNSILLATMRGQDPTVTSDTDLTSIIPAPGQVAVTVDITPPVTQLIVTSVTPVTENSDGSFSSPPTLMLIGSDSTGFPVQGTYYKWDSGGMVTYSKPFMPSVGVHTLTYYSIDQSGLSETPKTRTFAVGNSPPQAPSITINSPNNRALIQQINGVGDITVNVTASGVPTGGGVEFDLDQGTSMQLSAMVSGTPTQYTFSPVIAAEHTLDVYVLDSTGARTTAHDHKYQVGIGDLIVALGDDTVSGHGDNVTSDDTSADGRNGPYTDPNNGHTYGGFEPILNDMLTAARGFPNSVINAGGSGDGSSKGVSKIASLLAQYPTAANWIVQYGMNDLWNGVSASTYQSNIQSIVNQIHAVNPNAVVWLPKIVYQGKSAQDAYQDDIGIISLTNGNTFLGADLYDLFESNYAQFDQPSGESGTWYTTQTSPLLPNGIGYQQMAKLWTYALTKRAFLVSDGFIPTIGSAWGDKIQMSNLDKIGLSSSNLLLLCQRPYALPRAPSGTQFVAEWSWAIQLTNATNFKGGSITLTEREEQDTIAYYGTTWSHIYLALGKNLLSTSRSADSTNVKNEDLTATITQTGQVAVVYKP